MPRVPGKPAETLPGEGRRGDPPSWPLSDQSPAEGELWAALWATPQSAAWERLGSGVVRVVAHYVRVVAIAEADPTPRATLLGEIRQMEDRLGLTPKAMAQLRWTVEPAAAPAEVSSIGGAPRRRRLSVVDPNLIPGDGA